MVNVSAREPRRPRIAHTFGLLALLGAVTTVVVLGHDPALSSTRLAEPVPAPEITVVESEPVEPDTTSDSVWDGFTHDGFFGQPADRTADSTGGSGQPTHPTGQQVPVRATGHGTAEELRRSLFWSGVFGLAISLAGLGLVGTRRRMW
ncbi:hypothetical protein HCA58_06235 [Micromonospora sp. HNM0581]|uniref:hypothetical protein n=1 Tax=Micromonospora sp. HNM0581 TaxID=2716341 RepID=UPI00146D01A8|nr:hypothetical protein [Micromonospora sp. HNM0581]NLU77999.1 hypothetical protein [Micromonospora sp. HNM0581]